MKHRIPSSLCIVGFISGCAGLDTANRQPLPRSAIAEPRSVVIKPPAATRIIGAAPERRSESTPLSEPLSATPDTGDDEPFAIILVDPKNRRLTHEMESRLQRVVEETRRDERSLLRLESFVPAEGSPSFDLGRSDDVLKVVRDRLIHLGISNRRIRVSHFGAEHDLQRDTTLHWVEIHLVRAGAPSVSTSGSSAGAK